MSPRQDISIARVIARLNVGGPAIQAVLMTDEFNRRGFRTILLTGEVTPDEASMEYFAASKGVTPVKLHCMSRQISIAKDLVTLWRLWLTFIKQRPTIVHTHTAKAGTLGRIAAIMARVPVRVHTFHGHVFKGYFSKPIAAIFIAIERALAHHTDCIVTVSGSQKRELCEEFKIAKNDKIDVVPLGFELDPFLEVNQPRGLFRHSLRCSTEIPLIGWIGRFAPVKAPDLLIDSAAECAPDLAHFVMVGDGALRGYCESKIQDLKLGSRVAIVGCRHDLPEIYSDLDLVVLTSQNEGTPVALLEAMASGRAFIAADVGGIRDLMVGDPLVGAGMEIFKNGVLVTRQASAIAAAIRYLLDRPSLRESMGEAGREFVRSKFSVQRLADDLEHLYLKLATKKGLVLGAKGLSIPASIVTAQHDSRSEV